VDKKPRCQDISKAIVEYFRSECAVASGDGIETSSDKLATAIGCSPSSVYSHLRRLVEFGVIILKIGDYTQNNRSPKFFALGEGHEEGDEWRKIYYGGKQAPAPIKTTIPPVLPSEIVKANAKATSDKSLLEELVQAYAKIKELQEQILNVQHERNEALETVQQKQARIEELEQDLKLEAETARTNLQDISTLELQLREARSKIASNDRRIANNEGATKPFAVSFR